LYAASYDRLGDSVQAKNYTQKFFAVASPEEIQPSYYAFAGRIYAKFPETADSVAKYFQLAIQSDTVKEEQKAFVDSAAKIASRSGNYRMMLDIMRTSEKLNGGKLSETEYYNLSKNVVDAATANASAPFDSVKYMTADSVLQAYSAAYPEKPQGYSFRTRFAKMADKDSTRGLALDPIMTQNKFLATDTAAASKKTLFNNYYYLLIYYAQYAKDLPKEQEYQKAIDVTNQMKQLYSDPNSEEYQFADKTGKSIQANLDKFNKSKAAGGTSAKQQK
jgi:hypothetical protein